MGEDEFATLLYLIAVHIFSVLDSIPSRNECVDGVLIDWLIGWSSWKFLLTGRLQNPD